MPRYEITAPDGSRFEVNAPEGATPDEVMAYAKKNFGGPTATPSQALREEPAAVSTGRAVNSIPRQVGLTARYGLEGLADTAQIVTEPIAGLMRMAGIKTKPLGQIASEAADFIGLPSPQGANERVVADATKLVAGGAGVMGVGRLASALPGMVGQIGTALASNPAQQLSSAAGAGLASGASREAGGNGWQQTASGVIGGVLGGMVPGGAMATANAVRGKLAPMSNTQLDGQIAAILRTRDVDYSEIPERARQALRAELRSSLQAGKELDPDAVRRLADFRVANLTPTRGMLTQDPVQITREQNLAKIAANSGDAELHGLPRIQNQNNRQMISNLNDLGSNRRDAFSVGQETINAIAGRDAAWQRANSGLYDAARSMPGGEIPLNRADLVNNIYQRLAESNKLAYLPENISNMIDTISAGQVTRNGQTYRVPFDAKALDNLMTDIATAQRSTTDGNVRAALSAVRQAIDNTPIAPIKREFGGNQVVTQAGSEFLRNADAQAGNFMDALNQARAQHRARMQWQESSPVVERALAGAQPDKFFQQNVINGSLRDAEAFVQASGREAAKEATSAWLRDRALNGAADEVGKFSQSAFNKGLKELGDRKLAAIYSPEELINLRALGRASSYAQSQPVGSAVNNSNSGALVLGRAGDLLDTLARRLPMGQQLVADPLRQINISLTQRQAENLLPGLLGRQPDPAPLRGLLAPGIAAGGLLAAPVVP